MISIKTKPLESTLPQNAVVFVLTEMSEELLTQAAYRIAWYGHVMEKHGFTLVLPDFMKAVMSRLRRKSTITDAIVVKNASNIAKNAIYYPLSKLFESLTANKVEKIICLDRASMTIAFQHTDQACTLIDFNENATEASRFSYQILNLLEGPTNLFTVARNRLNSKLPSLQADRFILVATGPSIDEVDFSDIKQSGDKVIVANSGIFNSDLLNALQPEILVCSDPIFHASFSQYAERFREKLTETIRKYKSVCFVPARDYHIYEAYLPDDVVTHLIPIWFGQEVPLSTNLMKNDLSQASLTDAFCSALTLYTTSNVLTNFMLQIARNLTKTIALYGCDGRKVQDNSYFWGHGKSVQINDKMANIKQCHPSFFDIDYDDYYRKHIEQLRTILWVLHNDGITISCETPTHIPPLQSLRGSPYDNLCDLSVIIPAYNAATTIERTVQSCLAGTSLNFEIVIVDDGSTDATEAVCKKLAEQVPQVRYIRQSNQGVSSARNRGMHAAVGKYLSFIDADDSFETGALQKLFDFASNNNHFVVYGKTRVLTADGRALPLEIGGNKKQQTFHSFNEGYHVHTSGVMMHRTVAREIEFDTDLTNGEDLNYFVTLARHGYVFHGLGARVSNYIWQGDSITQTFPTRHAVRLFNTLGKLYQSHKSHPLYPHWNQEINAKAVQKQRVRVLSNGIFIALYGSEKISEKTINEFAETLKVFDDLDMELTESHLTNWWNRLHAGRAKLDVITNHRWSKPEGFESARNEIRNASPNFGASFLSMCDVWVERRKLVDPDKLIMILDKPNIINLEGEFEDDWELKLELWLYNVDGKLDSFLIQEVPSRTYPPMVFDIGPFRAMVDGEDWRFDCKTENDVFVNRFTIINGWNRFNLAATPNKYIIKVNGKPVHREIPSDQLLNIQNKLVIGGGYQDRVLAGTYNLQNFAINSLKQAESPTSILNTIAISSEH